LRAAHWKRRTASRRTAWWTSELRGLRGRDDPVSIDLVPLGRSDRQPQPFAEDDNQFALAMYAGLRGQPGNLCFSPCRGSRSRGEPWTCDDQLTTLGPSPPVPRIVQCVGWVQMLALTGVLLLATGCGSGYTPPVAPTPPSTPPPEQTPVAPCLSPETFYGCAYTRRAVTLSGQVYEATAAGPVGIAGADVYCEACGLMTHICTSWRRLSHPLIRTSGF
jgi:hypothetical protein